MRRLYSVPLATALLAVFATAVMAYVPWGWFYSSVIDTDANSQADLSVCYDWAGSPIYANRGQIDEEIEQWHRASFGSFSSNGTCDNDGSSIVMGHDDFGACSPVTNSIVGATNNPGNVGYSSRTIWFNVQCYPHFDWYDTDGIDAGKISALAVALHEVGHALGLHHSNLLCEPNCPASVRRVVMYESGPEHCPAVGNDWTLAFDDADGYRDRYPGILDTSTGFPASAGCEN